MNTTLSSLEEGHCKKMTNKNKYAPASSGTHEEIWGHIFHKHNHFIQEWQIGLSNCRLQVGDPIIEYSMEKSLNKEKKNTKEL